jgi:hypothetical protein
MNTDTITTLCIATIFIFPLLFGVIEYVTTPARVKKKLEQILDQRKRINNDLNTLKELSGSTPINRGG